MFIAALFIIVKTWKQTKSPSTDYWLKKWYKCAYICVYIYMSVCVCVCVCIHTYIYKGYFGLPQWPSSTESTCNARAAGDSGSHPGWGRSPGGGRGNPLQYSCLENPMDRGAWQATIHSITKSRAQLKQHSTHADIMDIYMNISEP